MNLDASISVAQYRALLSAGSTPTQGSARKVKRQSPEEDLHRMCFDWTTLMSNKHHVLKWMIHVPNGGKRPLGEAGKLKAMGAKPGFPDLFLPKKNLHWAGLAVELKSPVGRLSEAQGNWLNELQGEGYFCSVCRNFEDFELSLSIYLGLQDKSYF